MPKDLEDFDESELESILNSKMVQKYLAYSKLTEGIKSIKDDDVMYDQLLNGIKSRVSRDLAESTIEGVLQALIDEVESNTDALEEVDDEDEEGFNYE